VRRRDYRVRGVCFLTPDSTGASAQSSRTDPSCQNGSAPPVTTAAQAAWYHEHAGVQRQVTRDLAAEAFAIFEVLGDARAAPVLELGCGTGFLTAHIPPERVFATDLSPGMIAQARAALPAHQFAVADIEDPSLKQPPASFHLPPSNPPSSAGDLPSSTCHLPAQRPWSLAISSSALHWIVPFERAANRLFELAPCIAIAIMLDGTLSKLHAAREAVAPEKSARAVLPTAVDAARSLRHAGFSHVVCRIQTYRQTYKDAWELFTDLNRSGLTGSGSVLSPEELRSMAKYLEQGPLKNPEKSRAIEAEYRVGFFFGKVVKEL